MKTRAKAKSTQHIRDDKSLLRARHIEAMACAVAQEAYGEEFVRRQHLRELLETTEPALLWSSWDCFLNIRIARLMSEGKS